MVSLTNNARKCFSTNPPVYIYDYNESEKRDKGGSGSRKLFRAHVCPEIHASHTLIQQSMLKVLCVCIFRLYIHKRN